MNFRRNESDALMLERAEVERRLQQRWARRIIDAPKHIAEVVMAEDGDSNRIHVAVFDWMAARLHTEKALGEFMKMFAFDKVDCNIAEYRAREDSQFTKTNVAMMPDGIVVEVETVDPPEPTRKAICLIDYWLQEAQTKQGDNSPEYAYARAALSHTNRENVVRKKLLGLRLLESAAMSVAAIRICVFIVVLTFANRAASLNPAELLGFLAGCGVVIVYAEIRTRMLWREYQRIREACERESQFGFGIGMII